MLALAPPPAELVEQFYAQFLYPALQRVLTSATNVSEYAASDLLLVAAGLWMASLWVRGLFRAWEMRSLFPLARGLLQTLGTLAAAYLWFSLTWGLNYARQPLTDRLPFDARRATPDAIRSLGTHAVAALNAQYAGAHARGFPSAEETPAELVDAIRRVDRRLGRVRSFVPGRPKRTLLTGYFRSSGTDGMTSPFLLETLMNPDLTGPERPVVLAHEWAHLSGHAPEDEAGFVAIASSLQADISSQYSAWLSIALDVASQLPPEEGQALLGQLDEGPRGDRQRIVARLRARVPAVQRVGALVYDRYLKSQGVHDGLVSYSRVIELLVGIDPSHPLSWRNL